MGLVDVTAQIDIACPRAQVAAYAADPRNATKWYVNITSAEMLSEGPLRKGSRIAFAARFLSRQLRYTYEVVDYVPADRLVMRTSSGPFEMETSYRWESTPDGGTRMTLRNRGMPSGFSRLAAPFIAAVMRRANAKDLARLRTLLESEK